MGLAAWEVVTVKSSDRGQELRADVNYQAIKTPMRERRRRSRIGVYTSRKFVFSRTGFYRISK